MGFRLRDRPGPADNGLMPIHRTDGQAVAECPRCDAAFTGADVEEVERWMAAHWRVHDGEIGCGRRAPVDRIGD